MNKVLPVLIVAIFSGTTHAQTNAPTLVTNYVTAAEHFRRVNGQLYNIHKSQLWTTLTIRVTARQQGMVRACILTKQPIYESRWDSGNTMPAGSYGSRSAGWRRVLIGHENVAGRTILLRNAETTLSNGSETNIQAMRAGNSEDGTEIWDCGTANVVAVITTNRHAIKP